MTQPDPANSVTIETLRRRWLKPFITVQQSNEKKIRSLLNQGAQDAFDQVFALSQSSTFSAGVRTAQLRMVIQETQRVHKELFDELIPIIRNGQQDAAVSAVEGMSATDRKYLKAALGAVDPSGYESGATQSARLGIANAISSISKSDYKLSNSVYRTRRLANGWIKNKVTSQILRGGSAQEIAKEVRSSIRPDVPGGTGYAALRLGRTELNNAFHATAVDLSKDRPWVNGMDWHLSKTHKVAPSGIVEICEQYAARQWDVENVPAKPHPQCRCFVTPRLIAYDVFIRQLTAGQYRSWIDEAA